MLLQFSKIQKNQMKSTQLDQVKKVIEITIYLVRVHYMKVQTTTLRVLLPESFSPRRCQFPFLNGKQFVCVSKPPKQQYPIIQVIVKTEYCIYYLQKLKNVTAIFKHLQINYAGCKVYGSVTMIRRMPPTDIAQVVLWTTLISWLEKMNETLLK